MLVELKQKNIYSITMTKKTYTVLVIGILYHSRYWQRILAHTAKRIIHFIKEVMNILLVILRLIRVDFNMSIPPKLKDIYYYVLLKLASGYIKLKQTRIWLKLEYQKLDKVSILMKAQKIIMVVSIVLFAGALGLLGYRGMELVKQLRSEIEIEKNVYRDTAC